MKKIIKDYFTFSVRERNSAIILLVLIAFFIAFPIWYKSTKPKPVIDKVLLKEVEQLQQNNQSNKDSNYKSHYQSEEVAEKIVFEPFNFDPNTVDESGWHRLGLRAKTIKTILNYRNKGGTFRQAEDIKKIWGIQKNEAERMIPFIRIVNTEPAKKGYQSNKKEIVKPHIVDINTATIEELKIIPGMINGLQFRIIKYRERLGGFLNVEQVRETYGITDSEYALIVPFLQLNPTVTNKININTATDYDLSSHPYIEKNVAKAIVLYRIQHGNYQTISDIKKIVFIKESLYQKISPYLTTE